MEVQRICLKCGEVNTITPETLKEKYVFDENNKRHLIKYFECERCKEVNVLQIDDESTLKIFYKLRALTMKVIKKHEKHETITKDEVNNKDKYMKKLRAKRSELNELSRGKKFYDIMGNIFIESLTFDERGVIIDSNL